MVKRFRLYAAVILLVLIGAGTGAALMARNASAQAITQTYETTIPVSGQLTDPLSTSCSGETMTFTGGSFHLLLDMTTDDNGGMHGVWRTNLQDVTATGDVSGATYHFSTYDHEGENIVTARDFTFDSRMMIVGPGPDNNLVLTMQSHATVNADGTLTAYVERFTLACQ